MKTRVIGAIVLVAAAVTATFFVTRGGSAEASVDTKLAMVRQATIPYQKVAVAEAAGYEKLLDCFDSQVGGMGQHYVNKAALDTTIDANKPESMMYELGANGPSLVGVEYIVPQDAWKKSAPPSLFGKSYSKNDTLGLWTLHAWVWRTNPKGAFTDFNPSVQPCPSK